MALNDQHAQQDLPRADSPLVEGEALPSFHWYTFFRSLWVKTGAGFSSTDSAVVLMVEADGSLGAYRASTGVRIGKVTTT